MLLVQFKLCMDDNVFKWMGIKHSLEASHVLCGYDNMHWLLFSLLSQVLDKSNVEEEKLISSHASQDRVHGGWNGLAVGG